MFQQIFQKTEQPGKIKNIILLYCFEECYIINNNNIIIEQIQRKQQNSMAFVIGKQQKVSIFQPTLQTLLEPGPGSYSVLMNSTNKNSWQCAPFNNSQVKTSYFDVQQVKSGPGSYQPKYYKDLNSNNYKKNKGYVFASKVNRFDQQKSKNNKTMQKQPKLKLIYYQQPLNDPHKIENQNIQSNNYQTQYSIHQSQKSTNKKQLYYQKLQRSKSMMQQIRQNNNQHKVESIRGKKDFIRVILSNTSNTQNIQSKYIFKNINGKGIGPGAYQNINFQSKNKSITKWQLNKQKRFKTQGEQMPGPGYYQNVGISQNNSVVVASRRDKKLSSSFASTVIRSYMDSLIYKTNIPFKAAIMDDQKIKDLYPGPGSYNPQKMYKEKPTFNYGADSNFGSSHKIETTDQNNQIGPGSYDVDVNSMLMLTKGKKCNKIIKDIRNQIFNKKGKISSNFERNNSLDRSFNKKRLSQIQSTFNNQPQKKQKKKTLTKFSSLQQRCFSKLGTMNQQQRFKNKQQDKCETKLGPGLYYNESIASNFGANNILKKGISSVFKSSTNRNTFQDKQKQGNQIPYYNVIRNDIGYKAEKMKRYIENLKKINISQIPFQVGQKRFHTLEKQVYEGINEQQQDINQSYIQFVNKQKANKPSSCFKSNTKRNIYQNQKKPGPGYYDVNIKNNGAYSSLEKKSFNKNYGHLKVVRKKENDDNKIQNKSKNVWDVSRKNSQQKRNKSMINVTLTNRTQQKIQLIPPNKQVQQNK